MKNAQHSKTAFSPICFYFFLLFSSLAYSQLSAFDLQVTKTDETCSGNGSLTFAVTNTTPGATFIYSIYLSPNFTTPLQTTVNTTITGLASGSYKVVALQSLGNLSNTQEQFIEIVDQRNPLAFEVVGSQDTVVTCEEFTSSGIIIVNVTEGNPHTYEIITGPVIVPPQASNTFSNLPVGSYNIRVNDVCGDGLVQTFALVYQPSGAGLSPNLTLNGSEFSCNLIDCNTASLMLEIATVSANTQIRYPLTIQFTVLPPNNGTPVVINQTLTTGDPNLQNVPFNIPYYSGDYQCQVRVVDNCGFVYQTVVPLVYNSDSLVLYSQFPNECFKRISFPPNLCRTIGPYTVNFVSAPPGFNPLLFNAGHPGPFASSVISYQSTAQNEMPSGTYVIELTDSCGRTFQSSINLQNSTTDYIIFPMSDVCNPNGLLRVPNEGIPITTAIFTDAPAGYPFPLPHNVTGDIENSTLIKELAPGHYTLVGVNICGFPYELDIEIEPQNVPALTITVDHDTCAPFDGILTVEMLGGPTIVSISVTQAPAAYNHILPYDLSSFIQCFVQGGDNVCLFSIHGFPPGEYTLFLTDSCGRSYTQIVTVDLVAPEDTFEINYRRGCAEGFGSVGFRNFEDNFQSLIITAAPAAFNQTLPLDVSYNIDVNGDFYMNSFPEGDYTFETLNTCGVPSHTVITIPGLHTTLNNFIIQKNCGSFNIVFQHLDNEPYIPNYWLQRYNPELDQWEHPTTGVGYVEGSPIGEINARMIFNLSNTANINIAATGHFRVIKQAFIYSNGVYPFTSCLDEIYTFDFTGELKINSATTIPCATNGNEVHVDATGVAPLHYYITTKDGQPFEVDNHNSNVFSGLAAGIYNFQVTDLCGNIVNRLFDINTLPEPTIIPNGLCDGQNGQLTVQPFSYLSYQWWNGNAPGTILSTTNVLNFIPFSGTNSPGTYYVRIYSQTNLSCADKTISYTIPTTINPNAGQDAQATLCNIQGNVNLFSLLTGTFDTNGVWEEITDSGMLSGSNWLPLGVPFGTYTFRYRVTGFCSDFDESIVTIKLNPGTPTPVLNVDSPLCAGNSLALNVSDIPTATYTWTGPNNFSSNQQNPVINPVSLANAGTYSVTAVIDGCNSPAVTAEVQVFQNPEFTIEAACVNNVFTVTAVPVGDSFNVNAVTYQWTGPNNFSSSENPIIITGGAVGNYSLTVTNENDCSTTLSRLIESTFCGIPNVIIPGSDGANGSFDLGGLNVDKIEIYSRWGRLVYEKNNYIDEWKGQNMWGGFLPDSTYYYILYLRTGETKVGWVFLSRG